MQPLKFFLQSALLGVLRLAQGHAEDYMPYTDMSYDIMSEETVPILSYIGRSQKMTIKYETKFSFVSMCQVHLKLGSDLEIPGRVTAGCCNAVQSLRLNDIYEFDAKGLCAEEAFETGATQPCWASVRSFLGALREKSLDGTLVPTSPRPSFTADPLLQLEAKLRSTCPCGESVAVNTAFEVTAEASNSAVYSTLNDQPVLTIDQETKPIEQQNSLAVPENPQQQQGYLPYRPTTGLEATRDQLVSRIQSHHVETDRTTDLIRSMTQTTNDIQAARPASSAAAESKPEQYVSMPAFNDAEHAAYHPSVALAPNSGEPNNEFLDIATNSIYLPSQPSTTINFDGGIDQALNAVLGEFSFGSPSDSDSTWSEQHESFSLLPLPESQRPASPAFHVSEDESRRFVTNEFLSYLDNPVYSTPHQGSISINTEAVASQATDTNTDQAYYESVTQKLAAKGCHQTGGPDGIINSVEYTVDGNYKMRLELTGSEDFEFVSFQADDCDGFTNKGLSINDDGLSKYIIKIDLSLCKNVIQYNPNDFVSSIEVLNVPIDINFSVRPGSRGPGQEDSTYNFRPHATYYEDYIIDWNVRDSETSMLVIDDNGNTGTQKDNLQFNYFTYTDELFHQKTYSTKETTHPGTPTYVSIEPTNGYFSGKLLSLPEMCFLKDLVTEEVVQLWDISDIHDESSCVEGLTYQDQTGAWQFEVNFNSLLGKPFEYDNGNQYAVTCNLRVCANVHDNNCGRTIQTCDYMA